MKRTRSVIVVAVVCLVVASASPVRRSPELEARRRSAIDRSMIRFGRSYPAEPSAADIREAFQRQARKGTNFLRLGRSQPSTLTTDDLITLLKSYEEDYDNQMNKRGPRFLRFGRDPKFIRFGRSSDEENALGLEHSSDLIVSGYPQRKNRARDHFIRLGRDSEDVEEIEEGSEDRKKRSTVAECQDCQA